MKSKNPSKVSAPTSHHSSRIQRKAPAAAATASSNDDDNNNNTPSHHHAKWKWTGNSDSINDKTPSKLEPCVKKKKAWKPKGKGKQKVAPPEDVEFEGTDSVDADDRKSVGIAESVSQ